MRGWLFALALCLPSCSGDALKDAFFLSDLRVVSLSVDQPEAAPGTSVVVTPFVSDVEGAGRALTYSAEACIDPGINFGAKATCDGRPDRLVLATDVPLTLAAPNYTAAVATFNVTIPATILVGRTLIDQNNGVAYLLFYTVKAPGGVSVTAMKRLYASTRATKNTNPDLTAIQVNGAAPAALPTALAKVTPVYSAASSESYVELQTNATTETKAEELVMSWFTTDGKLEENRTGATDANDWTPPTTAPAGRNVLLVGVLRDQRGGEKVVVVTF